MRRIVLEQEARPSRSFYPFWWQWTREVIAPTGTIVDGVPCTIGEAAPALATTPGTAREFVGLCIALVRLTSTLRVDQPTTVA
jgi:hypothetical protein